MKNNNQDYDEIDLLKLFKALWHRAWAIVLAMVIGGGLAFSYAKFMVTPLYESSAMLYVNNSAISLGSTKVSISSSDLVASQGLIDTYSVILKSRSTLEAVIEKAELPYTYEQLNQMVSASSVDGTEVMKITTTDKDPVEGTKITNTIVDILPERIVTVVEGSSVQVVDRAVVPQKPVSPNVTKTTMIGILLGLVVSAAVIVVLSLVDTTVRSEDFLLDSYSEIPMLASIPNLTDEKRGGYYGYGYGYGYGDSSEQNRREEAV